MNTNQIILTYQLPVMRRLKFKKNSQTLLSAQTDGEDSGSCSNKVQGEISSGNKNMNKTISRNHIA